MPGSASIWIVVTGVGLVGAVLLALGLRGRLIHAGPTCRRCGFDLSGVRAAGKCPECGADLSASRAVRAGLRRVRPVVTMIGLLLLIASVGSGIAYRASAGNVRLNAYKPAWLLSFEAQSNQTTRASAALDELLLRANANALPKGIVERLATEGLRQQADASAVWLPQWADLVIAARNAGAIDDERWGEFLRNGVRFELVARPRVRQGGMASVQCRVTAPRLGSGAATVQMRFTRIAIGPGPGWSRGPENSGDIIMGVSSRGVAAASRDLLVTSPPGKQPIRAVVEVTVYDGPFDGSSYTPTTEPRYLNRKLNQSEIELSDEVEVVGPDEPLVAPIAPTPEIRALIERSLRIDELGVSARSGQGISGFEVHATNPIHNLAFDVVWRWRSKDGIAREQVVGGVTFSAGSGDTVFSGGSPITDCDSELVDVVLRPSADLALRNPKMESYWNGEVVFLNQRVKLLSPDGPDDRPGAAGGPSSGGDR
jgi:hypothetical protein